MKRIDFNEPFEKTSAKVHSLPEGEGVASHAEVEQTLHLLYVVAHGRSVETPIGRIPIAPPLDSFLRSKSWLLNTRVDLLLLARRRKGLRASAKLKWKGISGRSASLECRASVPSLGNVPRKLSSAKINGNK